MTRAAHRTTAIGTALLAAAAVVAVGCDKTNSTYATPPNSGTGMTGMGTDQQVTGPSTNPALAYSTQGAGGAPTYGEPTGTGFYTLDAAHGSGTGSGMMGYHGTGAMGTSAAISDMHKTPPPPKNAPQWVLPEQ